MVFSHCSALVEYMKCHPLFLQREFTTIVIVAVYIPPSTKTKEALSVLYGAIAELQTAHPDIRVWPAGATSALQECLNCTDWNMFNDVTTYEHVTDL